MDLIRQAVAQGRNALDEYESKQFLSSFGIPTCREALAADPDTAAALAEEIGFPIVLKASGPTLFHKTDIGGVVLNLWGQDRVRQEGKRLLGLPGCEALLIQETVRGARELACGLTRDAHFGPCVMFGLGGTLTELLGDVVFRLAPLGPQDACEMLVEIQANEILKPFRGESAVDVDALVRILVALGRIGVQHEEVAEIDINPLKIRPDGTPVSVDALIVLKPN